MNHEYTTSDLCLSTTLSIFVPILSIDSINPRRVVFSFAQTTNLTELIDMYWANSLTVEPKTFFNQLKTIKSRIYEA